MSQHRGCASASTPAAPSPISSRSTAARATMRVTKVAEHAGQSGDRAGARRRGDPRVRPAARSTTSPASRTAPRSPPTRCCRAQIDSLGLDRHRGLPPHPRDRPPVGARGLRQLVFLGEAGPHRAAAARARGRRPARFPRARSCGRSTRHSVRAAARVLPPAGHPRGRHLPDPFLRQRRRTSGASPRSSPRNIRTARCRCRATCCPNTANTSAP